MHFFHRSAWMCFHNQFSNILFLKRLIFYPNEPCSTEYLEWKLNCAVRNVLFADLGLFSEIVPITSVLHWNLRNFEHILGKFSLFKNMIPMRDCFNSERYQTICFQWKLFTGVKIEAIIQRENNFTIIVINMTLKCATL